MKKILLPFLFLNSLSSLAQDENLILTEKTIALWFESLQSSHELNEKIKLINQRLISDVNVYIKWSFPDGITVQRIPKLDSISKIRIQGFCKPLYILKYKEKEIAFRIENPLNNDLTKSVIELITQNNICGVEVWTDDKRKMLYGTSQIVELFLFQLIKRKYLMSSKI